MAKSIYKKNTGETKVDALERTLKEIDVPQNIKTSEYRIKRSLVLIRKEVKELKQLLGYYIEKDIKYRGYLKLPWYKKIFTKFV